MASKNEIVVRAGVGVAGIAVVVTGASSAAASTATVLLSGGAALALAAIGFGIYRLLQPPALASEGGVPMDDAYFKKAYEADARNRERQSWTEYRGWVESFYGGRRFPPIPGWTKRQETLSKGVCVSARQAVARRIDVLGKAICAEWAKDNSVRKVSTDDLRRFGAELDAAAKRDQGDGAQIIAAADSIESAIKR